MRFSSVFMLRAAAPTLLALGLAGGCGEVDHFPPSGPDIRPRSIADAVLSVDSLEDVVTLTWTAPASGGGDTLSRYDIRYDYRDTFEWEVAQRVLTPPVPSSPGQLQSYQFTHPEHGRVLSAAIRSIDADGNVSGLSNLARAQVPGLSIRGRVREVLSDTAAAVVVTVTGSEFTREATADPDGRFTVARLPESEVTVRIEGDGVALYPVVVDMILTEDVELDLEMIHSQPTVLYPSQSRLTLFKEAMRLHTRNSRMHKWPGYPLDIYIPPYTTPGGLDYRAATIAAMTRWSELSGIELFRLSASPPTIGITVAFRTREEMGIQIGYTTHTNAADGTPQHSDINVVNTIEGAVTLNRVLLHELGHTIRLSHLASGYLMYGGQPLPDDPTADEVWLVRVLNGMDDGTDLSIYREVGE
jgi:hypothetical protein